MEIQKIERQDMERELVINRDALRKAQAYARLVCEEFGEHEECGGYLLAPRDKNDGVVYDCTLIHNQKVSAVRVKAEPGDSVKTKKEYNAQDYKTIGSWHSHHIMGAGHSSIDDRDLERMILEAGTNCMFVENPRQEYLRISSEEIYLAREKGSDIAISLGNSTDYQIKIKQNPDNLFHLDISSGGDVFELVGENPFCRISIKSPNPINIRGVGIPSEVRKSVVYSAVVDSFGEVYAEAAIIDWNGYEIGKIRNKKNIRVKVADVRRLNFFDGDLRNEIKEKVKPIGFLGKFLRVMSVEKK